MNPSQIDYSKIIIETLNTLFSNLLSSIDTTLYSLLDNIVFIDTDIVENSFFNNVFGSVFNIGLISIANSLLWGFTIYYCCKLIFSSYISTNIEHPYQFIFKALIFSACIAGSLFICKEIIFINSLICSAIREIGSTLFHTDISFLNLLNKLNLAIYNNSNSIDLFSFNGLIKSFITFGLLNLLFSYSLRYIMVQVFVLLSPFAFLSLVTQSTSWLFKTWIRNFISLLLIQIFISFILLIIFSMNINSNSLFSQLMYIGAIYALSKSNYFLKELTGGLSTDVNAHIGSIRSLIK